MLGSAFLRWRHGRVSFAQSGEDLIVAFLLECLGVQKGEYLDIGAHHPTYLNNTCFFHLRGWRGTNVDPMPESLTAFERYRPRDRNLCAGIGATTGRMPFYVFDPKTLSTFDELAASRYQIEGHKLLMRTEVPILSVPDLVEEFAIPRDLALLSIDIEGGELTVIQHLLGAGVSPTVIICETAHYSRSLRQASKDVDLRNSICRLGYETYADTFINTIFVASAVWR